VAPSFEHHGRNALPMIEDKGVSARLILGNAYGEHAPARMFSETFYADVKLHPLARLPMPDEHEGRAIYIVEGSISVAGQEFGTMQMRGSSTTARSRRPITNLETPKTLSDAMASRMTANASWPTGSSGTR
jgi:redox-sensitive bicupin YhaK (pirin superfamily)